MPTLSLPIIFVVLLSLLSVCTAQKNVTVASSSSELQYSPSVNAWTDSSTCPGGYHYISRIGASVSFEFVGVAIYIVSSRERPGGLLQVNIDGRDVGNADRYADLEVETCGFVVFGQNGLPHGPHTIVVTHQGPSPGARGIGYIALQTFIYTSVDPPAIPPPPVSYNTSSTSTDARIPMPSSLLGGGGGKPSEPSSAEEEKDDNKPAPWKFIAGGVAAGLAILAIGIGIWLVIRRRNAKKRLDRRVSLATLGAPMGHGLHPETYPAVSPYTLHNPQPVNPQLSANVYSGSHAPSIDPTKPSLFLPSIPPASVTSYDPSIQKHHSPMYPPSSPAQWSSTTAPPEKSALLADGAQPVPQQPAVALTEPDIIRIASAVARITQGDGGSVHPQGAAAVQQYGVPTLPTQQQANPTTQFSHGSDAVDNGPAPPAYSEYRNLHNGRI